MNKISALYTSKRHQAEETVLFLSNLDGFRVDKLLTADAVAFDVEGIWREVIKYETPASSSCLLSASETQWNAWLSERTAFLGVKSAVLVSVALYCLLPLVSVEVKPDAGWMKALFDALRRDRIELDVIFINQEQTRLLAFVETEHEILAIERVLNPFLLLEKETV